MGIISLDSRATAGTNYRKWEVPFKEKENMYLKSVEAQNRTNLCAMYVYIDTISTPETESGSVHAIILRKMWEQRITDSLHWEGKIRIYAPMKVCLGVHNCSLADELTFRVQVDKE